MAHIRNWGRTVRFRPDLFSQPRDVDELRAIVGREAAAGRRVRVMGAGHSWTPLVETSDVLLDLRRFDACEIVDAGRVLVSVGAGVRLHTLNNFLAGRGLALRNLSYISDQTAVGAVMTGTHGTGPAAVLATHIERLTLLTADGTVRDLGPGDGDLFDAARISLGAMGIVTEMQLSTVPRFNLRERRGRVRFADAFGPEMSTQSVDDSYLHYEWLPFTDDVISQRCDVTADPADIPEQANPPRSPALQHLGEWMGVHVAGRLIPPGRMNRLALGTPRFRPGTRVGRSDLVLNGTLGPCYHESEYGFPVEKGPEVMRAYREILERERPALNFPVRVRFAPGDDVWLSQAHGRPTVFINIIARPGRAFRHAQRAVEPMLQDLGGRPHWGKCFRVVPGHLARAYPSYERFRALLAALDPRGVFRNPFIDLLFPRS